MSRRDYHPVWLVEAESKKTMTKTGQLGFLGGTGLVGASPGGGGVQRNVGENKGFCHTSLNLSLGQRPGLPFSIKCVMSCLLEEKRLLGIDSAYFETLSP